MESQELATPRSKFIEIRAPSTNASRIYDISVFYILDAEIRERKSRVVVDRVSHPILHTVNNTLTMTVGGCSPQYT